MALGAGIAGFRSLEMVEGRLAKFETIRPAIIFYLPLAGPVRNPPENPGGQPFFF
jgi:hypothetical protein